MTQALGPLTHEGDGWGFQAPGLHLALFWTLGALEGVNRQLFGGHVACLWRVAALALGRAEFLQICQTDQVYNGRAPGHAELAPQGKDARAGQTQPGGSAGAMCPGTAYRVHCWGLRPQDQPRRSTRSTKPGPLSSHQPAEEVPWEAAGLHVHPREPAGEEPGTSAEVTP